MGATVQDTKTKQGVATNIDGKFTVTGTDLSELKISYIGHKTQTVKDLNEKNLIIKLEEDNKTLNDVIVTSCKKEDKQKINAKEALQRSIKIGDSEKATSVCLADVCIGEPGEYEKQETYLDDDDNCTSKEKLDENKNKRELCQSVCVKVKCTETELKNATGGKVENGQCIPVCDENNGFTRSINNVCERTKCAKSEIENLKKQDKNIDTFELDKNGKCVPSTCIQDYKLKGNVCVKYQCSTAEKESVLKSGAKGAKWDGTKCVPSQCDTDNGYTENKNNECVLTNCTKAQLQELKQQQGVADGKLENGTCVPICKKNYHLNEKTQKCEENKCPTAEEDWNGKECVKVKCSPDDLAAINAKEAKWENNTCIATDCDEDKNFRLESGKCICKDPYTLQNGACVNADILAEKQKAYDEAKAKEQSTENKLLGGLTTAATGIGTMELMQGMAEQSADKDAMADMATYIETMRCTYGDGKQVKAGPEEIELPGANDAELMKLRSEYLALAADLKERKEALGMKPGIESEVIIDRAQTGLYDDENVGITSGNYASLYRAQALKSEADQAKIDDASKTSSNRVKYGAIAAGAGVVGGILGNELINGKLGEKIKSAKEKKNAEKNEKQALEKLQKCLKDGGAKNTSDLKFDNFTPSILHLDKIYCSGSDWKDKLKNKDATTLFADTTDESTIKTILIKNFDCDIAGKLLDEELCNKTTENTSTQNTSTQHKTQNNSINSSTSKKYDSFIVDDWGDCWKIEEYIFTENSQNYKPKLLSYASNKYKLGKMEWMSIINDKKITGESKCEYLDEEKETRCLCRTKSTASSWTNVLTLTDAYQNDIYCRGNCPAHCAANADKL